MRSIGTDRVHLEDTRHAKRARDDDDLERDDLIEIAPGKLTADEIAELPARYRLRMPVPGKLTGDAVGDLTPGQALRYYETTFGARRIDRRAEHDDTSGGDLASAFSFIEESRGGQVLPRALAASLGRELGVDLSGVRIHTDARAAEAAAVLHARAFTIGDDIYFAAGAYDPDSDDGIALIAHEAAHVAQQRRSTAPVDGKRAVSSAGDPHERDAEQFARGFRRARRTDDPAAVVNEMRRAGRRLEVPFRGEMESFFDQPLDNVEVYTGEAARLACELMSAAAFAVQNVVAFADPSPQRETLLHELAHVVQARGKAPTSFELGSLSISRESDAAEVEARKVERGGAGPAVREAAPAGVVHRTGPTTTTTTGTSSTPAVDWDMTKAMAKLREWLPKYFPLPAGDPEVFGIDDPANPGQLLRFPTSSAETFQLRQYQAAPPAHTTEAEKKASERDLTDVRNGAKGGDWRSVGLAFVEDRRWTYIGGPENQSRPSATVKELDPTERKDPDPKVSWQRYCKTIIHAHAKGSLKAFDKVPLGSRNYSIDLAAMPKAPTKKECEIFRDEIRKACLAEPLYAWSDTKFWRIFNSHIADAPDKLPQGLAGEIFKEISKRDTGLTFAASEAFFYHTAFSTKTTLRKADGFTITGDAILLEAKSGETPDDKFLAQARDYAYILEMGVPATKPDEAKEQGPFQKIYYTFPTPELAAKYEPLLKQAFVNSWDKVVIKPLPNAAGSAKVKANPTFDIPLTDKTATSHELVNPAVTHPGMIATKATIKTKTPGASELAAGGSVTFDVAMGTDAVKGQQITKPITPEANNGGTIENKLPGLETSLKKIFKRIETDAKLTDEGVEATIKVTPGPGGIPGLNIVEPSQVTARIGASGELSVTGTIGLEHTSKKIAGTVTVGYGGGDWTITGTCTVAAGMIEGLSEFTANVKYDAGQWSFGVDQVSYEKKLKAITLKGTAFGINYDLEKGSFSGLVRLDADLGMFGTASAQATIEDNKLKGAQLDYDSPELKYPAKKEPPTIAGTLGGTLKYEEEKFSGNFRGTARLNVPALQKLAGEGGLGLAVDAHVNPDGSYGGTVRTTSPLKFGKHFEIPSLSCTIEDDGSVVGDFAIKIKDIKYLESAELGCRIDKDGFKVVSANVHAEFGKPTDKMWGALDVGYDAAAGLKITGTLNVKIKEGMVAKGTLTYNSEKNAIDVALTVDEITLFDISKTQKLFEFSKQIPLVSFYSIIGIYLDLGLDLDFAFSMKLGLKPTITLDGLSFETWEYDRISAEIELLGQLRAALTATPKVGLGLFAISPSLLRGGGGIKVPITGEALLKPTGKLKVGYTPSGGVEGDATLGMQLTFGIKGAVKPYAEAAVLDGAWNPSWTGDSLADFEILPPKELFNFTLDLGGDMAPKEPQIPTSPQAPAAPTAARQLPQEAPKTTTAGDNGPGRDAVPPTAAPAGGAADDSMFKMASLTGALKGLPGYATISGFMEKAGKVWDKIKGFFGRVAKAFKSFFESIGNAIEEVLDGFAKEGLGYLPKLIQKIVGPTVWEIIEPIVTAAAGTAEQILELFETDPPASAGDFFPWGLKLMQRAFGVAFNSLPALISALATMASRLGGLVGKIVTQMVRDGMIGVKRHQHYYWAFGDHYVLATDEYKINLLGANVHYRASGLIDPQNLVAFGLFQAFENMGVPATNMAADPKAGDTYRDRWV